MGADGGGADGGGADGGVADTRPVRLDGFTSERIERIIALVVGVGSVALSVQAFVQWASIPSARDGVRLAVAVAVLVSLVAMILACLAGRLVRCAAGAFAVVFPLALVAWPFVGDPDFMADPPWMWYLLNVCTAAAVVAFPLALQVAWAVGIPALYAVMRSIAGATALDDTVLDPVFALFLGGLLVALAWMLRTMARDTDRARVRADTAFALAAEADAAERERVAVAALMHDSVLAALIAASRSGGPREEALAATMARDALTRLADADRPVPAGSDEPVPAAGIPIAVERALADGGVRLPIAADVSPDAVVVPGTVARAVVEAALQAIANAHEHAGSRGLTVRFVADADRLRLVVADEGSGFDVHRVPDDRLGIRGSIVARLAAVAGRASVESGQGGTTITLTWEPAP